MSPNHKPVVWLYDKPQSPPLSEAAQDVAGSIIREIQRGGILMQRCKKRLQELDKE